MTTKAKSLLGLLAVAGTVSAIYSYLSVPKKKTDTTHYVDKKMREHKKKSTVLNCEIGLACDEAGRRCPGYEKCGERSSCAYGLTEEMVCEVHGDDADANVVAQPDPDPTDAQEPATEDEAASEAPVSEEPAANE